MVSTINLVFGLIIAIAFGAILNELAAFIGSKSFIISEITKLIHKLIQKISTH